MSTITAEQNVEKTERSSRTALNFWVDTVTALLFALLLGTSFIMKWILPPGTCDGDGVKIWLGHSRHWWGDIHFWAAVLMILLIIWHIQLHWGWVTKTWGRFIGSLATAQTWVVLVLMAGLIAVPFIIPSEILPIDAEHVAVQEHIAINGDGTEEVIETKAAAVAPCGIEGLSCADCPAANDRLFGGGCAGTQEEDKQEEKPGDGKSGTGCGDPAVTDCSSCPSAGSCPSAEASEDDADAGSADTEGGEGTGCGDSPASDCSSCPSAGNCPSAQATEG